MAEPQLPDVRRALSRLVATDAAEGHPLFEYYAPNRRPKRKGHDMEPERPEQDPVNVVTMAQLVLAAGREQRGKFNAILDAYAGTGGTATHLLWTLAHELAAGLQQQHGADWEQVAYLTAVDVEASVNAVVALADDAEKRPADESEGEQDAG